MDRESEADIRPISWLPRARGDGPIDYDPYEAAMAAPPRTRGWTFPT